MSLNKDDPVVKSFIDMGQQYLQTMLGDIETRILQVCNSCTSAEECYEKLPALDNEIPNDLQTLLKTLKSQGGTIINQYPGHFDSITSAGAAIDVHYAGTFAELIHFPSSFGDEIYVGTNNIGTNIFPDRLKLALDSNLEPLRAASAIFFGWLELQPIQVTTS